MIASLHSDDAGRARGARVETPHRAPKAFTLIELLIAVTAFSIVLAAINAVFYSALRLRNKADQSFAEALPLQHTLTVMKRDLANIVPPGGILSGALQTTPTSGLNMNNGGSSATSIITPGQVSPNFFASTGIIDETSPFSEIQKISYVLLDPTNRSAGRDLFRSVTRNLLPSLQDQPIRQPLMSGVQNLAFLYYDGMQWRDSWDSTVADIRTGLTNTLPQAIKVQITLAARQTGRSFAAPVELVVPITVQLRTNDTSQTSGGAP